MLNKGNKKYNNKSRLVRNRIVYAKTTLNNKSDSFNKKIYIVLFISLAFNLLLFNDSFMTSNVASAKEKEVVKEKEVIKVPDNYLFLGDSITEYYDLDKYYPDLPVVNSGIAGDTTEDILNDMEGRVYQYNPSKIFLLIGTNDLQEDKSVDEVFNNIKKIIELIEENRPDATIYLESIYPVNESDNKKIKGDVVDKRNNKDIKEINKKLKKYAAKNNITYIDLYDTLKDSSDNLALDYTTEGLHVSQEGYEEVTKVLKKYIKQW